MPWTPQAGQLLTPTLGNPMGFLLPDRVRKEGAAFWGGKGEKAQQGSAPLMGQLATCQSHWELFLRHESHFSQGHALLREPRVTPEAGQAV